MGNGVSELLSDEFRGIVVYRCPSHLLNGYPVVYCNASGQWSPLQANCITGKALRSCDFTWYSRHCFRLEKSGGSIEVFHVFKIN